MTVIGTSRAASADAPAVAGPAVFELTSVLAQLPLPATSAWPEGVWDVQVHERGPVSLSLFSPRGRDRQSVHDRDEAYVIVKGRGILRCGEEERRFGPGDLLCVPAGQAHQFEGDLADLVAWVVFWDAPAGPSNKAVVDRFVAAWQAGDVDAALALTGADCLYSMTTGDAPGLEFRGRDAVRTGFALGMQNEPGTAVVFSEPFSADDRVVLEWRVERLGDGTVIARGVDLFTLRDGLIVVKDAHRKVFGD